jgi:polyhydroxybutyrate depolymerase
MWAQMTTKLLRVTCLFALLTGAASCSDGGHGSGEPQDEDPVGEAPQDAAAPRKDAGKPVAGGKADASAPPPRDASAPIMDASSPAKDAGPPASDASPSRDAAPPGLSPAVFKTIDVGGVERTFRMHVPYGLDRNTPVPLVSVHHGFTMSGKVMEDITTWKQVAERERFVVVFPDGGGSNPWNVGEGVCNVGSTVSAPATQDDFGFVRAMIAEVQKTQPINPKQVFVGGFSMGGYFANNIGCKGKDIVRAIAAHSGGTYTGDCPGNPIPVLVIHGDADGLIPYQCGKEAYGYWVTRNKCGSGTDAEAIKEGSCVWNQGCPAGQEVGMCTMKAMDHGWAGTTYTGSWLMLQYGGGAQYENGAELMWKFFKRYL